MKVSSHAGLKNRIAVAMTAAIVCFGVGIGTTGVANAAEVETNTVYSSLITTTSKPSLSDEELDFLIARLDQLPDNIKRANPKDIHNYATKLDHFLAGGSFSDVTGITPMGTNWPKCIFEIGMLVVQYGIPVAKVLKWLKEAKAIWGGVSGIWWAIRHGVAAAEMGSDAAKVLSGLLGTQGVIDACFNA